MNLSRRRLFGFGAALVAAPAIVRVSALMSISVPKPIITEPVLVHGFDVARDADFITVVVGHYHPATGVIEFVDMHNITGQEAMDRGIPLHDEHGFKHLVPCLSGYHP